MSQSLTLGTHPHALPCKCNKSVVHGEPSEFLCGACDGEPTEATAEFDNDLAPLFSWNPRLQKKHEPLAKAKRLRYASCRILNKVMVRFLNVKNKLLLILGSCPGGQDLGMSSC